MTKGLENFLDLPHLDEILKEEGVLDIQESELVSNKNYSIAEKNIEYVEGRDHGEAMDDVRERALKLFEDMVDMGWNIDPSRQSRTFEVAGQYLRMAKDAADSKRDAQLKTMQLALNQKKLELSKSDEKDNANAISAEAVIHEDRNELIKQARAQIKKND